MTYPEALAWLYSTQVTGIKLGLDGMRRLLEAQGGQPPGRFVHVAGTNGKGSVCAMMEAAARAGGWRTGLFTSPHLLSFRERLQVDGEPISEVGVAEGLTRLRERTAGWDPAPTFFEYTAALALDWFRAEGAQAVAWETGLGGRLDATNVIDPAACALTAIGLDHQAYLGDTLEAVAVEKAGIIKPGVPVVSGPQPPEAAAVIARVACERGAALRVVEDGTATPATIGLAGSHQRVNAAVALAALAAAGITVEAEAARRGLAAVDWPGRFQRVGDVVLDGAHNPAAARRLAQTWAEEFPGGERPTVILGVLADKDAAGIARELGAFAGRFIVTPVRSPRGGAAEELLALLPTGTRAAADFDAALALAREGSEAPILVTGSLFLIGEALGVLTGAGRPELSWQ